jgi:Mg2+ and Co2+ transporter CorA
MPSTGNDKAPLFKNWNYWYALVIGFLIVLIILFSFFTKKFA